MLSSRTINKSWKMTDNAVAATNFYMRYYVGHKGKFGHEFLEFEFRPDGKLNITNVLKFVKIMLALIVEGNASVETIIGD